MRAAISGFKDRVDDPIHFFLIGAKQICPIFARRFH